jgi:hypothetical protein
MNQAPECSNSAAIRTSSRILFVVNLFLTVLVTLFIFRSRSSFDKIFKDFEAKLPAISSVIFMAWYAWLLPVLAALSIAKEMRLTNYRVALILNGIHLLAILLILGIYVTAVFEPLIQLIQKLSR